MHEICSPESNRASSPARRHDDKRAGINLNNFNPRIFIIPMTTMVPHTHIHIHAFTHLSAILEYACVALSTLHQECRDLCATTPAAAYAHRASCIDAPSCILVSIAVTSFYKSVIRGEKDLSILLLAFSLPRSSLE